MMMIKGDKKVIKSIEVIKVIKEIKEIKVEMIYRLLLDQKALWLYNPYWLY
jgi:hypothetical protein